MIDLLFSLYVLLLLVAVTCSLIRLWKGPTMADRLNAADVIAICLIGFAIGQGWHRADPIWLDVAMVAGLVLFVGTVAVALFLNPTDLSREDDD